MGCFMTLVGLSTACHADPVEPRISLAGRELALAFNVSQNPMKNRNLHVRLVLCISGVAALAGFCFPGVEWQKALSAIAVGVVFSIIHVLAIRSSKTDKGEYAIIINAVCMGFLLFLLKSRKGIPAGDWATLHFFQNAFIYLFIGLGLSHAYRMKYAKPANQPPEPTPTTVTPPAGQEARQP
jgi:hypothetical protein